MGYGSLIDEAAYSNVAGKGFFFNFGGSNTLLPLLITGVLNI